MWQRPSSSGCLQKKQKFCKFSASQSGRKLSELLLSEVDSGVLGLDLQEEKSLAVIVDPLVFLGGEGLRPGGVSVPFDLLVVRVNFPGLE